MEFEWKEDSVGKLGWGVMKDVLTRKDIWHIDNLFWDKLSHSWYVKATPIIPEGEDKSKYCDFVDFHVSSAYFKKITKNVEPYTLVD